MTACLRPPWRARNLDTSATPASGQVRGLAPVGLGARVQAALEHLGLDRQRRQALGDVVVQLARDAAALLVLGAEQAPRQGGFARTRR